MNNQQFWDEFAMQLTAEFVNTSVEPASVADRVAQLADALVEERKKRATESTFQASINGVIIGFDVHGWSQEQLEALQYMWNGFAEWQGAQRALTVVPPPPDTLTDNTLPEDIPDEPIDLTDFARRRNEHDDCPSER